MAIIVEEEKRAPSFITILGVVIIVGITAFITYSLFFAPAPFVETIVPTELETTSTISKIELNVSGVTDSPVFKSLKDYIQKPEVPASGRVNPFEPF